MCFSDSLVCVIGLHPFTFNGSVSSAEFTFVSNVNVSPDVSLRVRTRQASTLLIDIRSDSSRFFKMALYKGRINVSFALGGESWVILSGDIRVYCTELLRYKLARFEY